MKATFKLPPPAPATAATATVASTHVKDPKTAESPPPEVPEIINDATSKKTYYRGKFLGKGGFARCYEVREGESQQIYACKVVSKSLLVKQHQREKMAQEISIHRDVNHEFIVKFHSFFEDDLNVYIILELCTKKSLMELQKRRRTVTEPEARYLLQQIMTALAYLHEKKVIHRDLKLGNIFINEEMNLKIGDFGLATVCERQATKRFTLCGTPNYIAPEVLVKKGHSFEVDIWSSGCILYTLLLGKPPFETTSLKDTYTKIRRGEYAIPGGKVSLPVRNLISRMLQVDPALRPTARQVLNHEFLTQGFIPKTLPSSILTMPPRFDFKREEMKTGIPVPPLFAKVRSPLGEQSQRIHSPIPHVLAETSVKRNPATAGGSGLGESTTPFFKHNTRQYMQSLQQQLKELMASNPLEKNVRFNDETEDPNAAPLIWISKWVDYSDKYGFGYQLSDDSIGVAYNDTTKMILLPDASNLQYIERGGEEKYFILGRTPAELQKKVKLMHYFQKYMTQNLLKAGGDSQKPDYSMARLPSLWTWFRTSRAVVMVLTNGTMQINNFRDHSKVILCPLLGAITTLEHHRPMKTYRFTFLQEQGCTKDLTDQITYAIEKLQVILATKIPPQKTGPGENKC